MDAWAVEISYKAVISHTHVVLTVYSIMIYTATYLLTWNWFSRPPTS